MSQHNSRAALLQVRRDIAKVKVNLKNTADRSSNAALRALRTESRKIAQLAAMYAPFKTGLLDGSTGATPSFVVIERAGVRGRKEISVELNMRKWKMVGKRRVTLAQYADVIHSGYSRNGKMWKPGKGTVEKAASLGLSPNPTSSGKYVGRLFLARAANHRRGAIEFQLKRAIREALT